MDRRRSSEGFFEQKSLPIRPHDKLPTSSTGYSSPDDTRRNDDFYRAWDRFLARSPSRALQTSALAQRVEQTQRAASRDEKGLNSKESFAASYERAKTECESKVHAIVTECKRLNQKFRDRLFDLEQAHSDCMFPLVDRNGCFGETNPSGVKSDIFENPSFNAEGACGDDVMQGNLGNCWFIAALVSVSAKPGLMQRLCVARDEEAGVYGFVFFRDGEWIPEVVDDRLFLHVSDGDDLFVGKVVEEEKTKSTFNTTNDITKLREYLQKGSEALFFARCRDNSDTWLPLIEKAYAKAHGDYMCLHGGLVSEGTEDLTGGVSVCLDPSEIMDKSLLWTSMMQVNGNFLFAGSARHYRDSGKFDIHAYAVLQATEHKGLRLLKIRDPWGTNRTILDGPFNQKFDKWNADLVEHLKFDFKDPGVLWMTFENFLKYFQSIQRTRLFDNTWTVTQQWTSINVAPGGAAYLDTSFQIALGSAGPVVIVLCQPDDRYFQCLEGRYSYSLHFRVYNSKDMNKYLARSMHVSSNDCLCTRSVNVDLDLDAGDYTVLVKITPNRRPDGETAEAIIDAKASERKHKLLQIGRNFELAHAKGKLREKEEDNRRKQKEQTKKDFRDRQAKSRTRKQLEKMREKKRKDRISAEKSRREKADLMRRAGALASADGDAEPKAERQITGYVGNDFGINAGLEDDDFEWDSSMDGDVFDSDSEPEEDWYADDPWNAVCVLGLRVYSQASDVTIGIREDDGRKNKAGGGDLNTQGNEEQTELGARESRAGIVER